jgi:hypothetical protein
MGIVIRFRLYFGGSAKPKRARNSGLNTFAPGVAGSDKIQTYFAGMTPSVTQPFTVCLDKPSILATSERFPCALSTEATVIDIALYTSRARNLSRQPKIRNKVICNPHIMTYNLTMANRLASKKGRPYAHIGERLERIQVLLGYGEEGGGAQMAMALNIREGQWSVFRSGIREIGIRYAARLCDWCDEYLDGVTMDWIFRGKGPSPRPIQRALPGLRRGA